MALFSKTLNDLFVQDIAYELAGANFTAVPGNSASNAPIYKKVTSYSDVVYMTNTNKGYTYSLTAQIVKSFYWGLSLNAVYTFGHSYNVFDGSSSVAYSNWKYNYARNTNAPELAISGFDVPHRIMASATTTRATARTTAGQLTLHSSTRVARASPIHSPTSTGRASILWSVAVTQSTVTVSMVMT